MQKKVILIIAIFLLMMNLLIGVIYKVEATDVLPEEVNVEQEEKSILDVQESKFIKNNEQNNRQYYILLILIVFVTLLILIEKFSSIKTILRILFTSLILYFVYIKGIVNDNNIIIITLFAIFLIASLNIFIKNGVHKKSFIELLAVIVTTLIIGLIILAVFTIFEIDMSNDQLNIAANFKDLIVSGSVIALLGIYINIISKMLFILDEEKDKKEDIAWRKQFKIGIKLGKELTSEKINMIFLVFISMILIPIYINILDGYSLIEILNSDYVFAICTIALIGCIGIIFSVIITAILYAILNRKKTIYKTVSENKIDGKRSLKL